MKAPLTATVLGALLLAVAPMTTFSQSAAVSDLFVQKCALCHGKDGAGQTIKGKKLKLKDIRSAEVQKLTDAQMTDLMVKGKGDMQSYAKELSAQQMKDLVSFMRSIAKK